MLTDPARTLSSDLQSQTESIWAEFEVAKQATADNFEDSRQPYLDALQKLEKRPTVLRLGYSQFLDAKVDDVSQLHASRGEQALTQLLGGELESFRPSPIMLNAAAEVSKSTANVDVRFPVQVKIHDDVPLIVQLTREQSPESRVLGSQMGVTFDAPAEPEYVDMILNANGFEEITNVWKRTIIAYPNRDSQPAVFVLKGIEEGNHELTIEFYHINKLIGQVKFESLVWRGATSMNTTPNITHTTSIDPFGF